ncbi:MAG: DNA repair protein RadA [Flavobacteriales bacterium TMED96]|nr:MAG: DNA repair protein RadA [Flavobacteriales bacterium TMED96]|tara:strand:+ start:612 stop:1973 length:1362 start_codon:yes stop_codon:yes gene_type:complete
MNKEKVVFYCKNCGNEHAKWHGQCKYCKEWNSLKEKKVSSIKAKSQTEFGNYFKKENIPLRMSEIDSESETRLVVIDDEWNNVLGGGLVPGSVSLISGEPGIGKSTLLLQISMKFDKRVLYVSGEESLRQIKVRSERIGKGIGQTYILSETETDNIFERIKEVNPEILIIDSIQTLHSKMIDGSPGSVIQIRECSSELIKYAKNTGSAVILIGHLTKDGNIAGPKVLEHMVDVVMSFEGDNNHSYRILRAKKNRFGSTSEIGIYEMLSSGLREVKNPNEIFLTQNRSEMSGHAIGMSMEGIRPLTLEVQALVSSAVYGTPQRSSTGFNSKRLNMLLAVLEKRAGVQLSNKDVFLNITGGVKSEDPSLDLAIVSAILSSYHDTPLNDKICFASEIGLSGELRPVQKLEKRISEAKKLGYQVFVTSNFKKDFTQLKHVKILGLDKIDSLITHLFE